MPDTIGITMYNVGFGDCFLLVFPNGDAGPFRILVDCGAHASGYPAKGWKPEMIVDEIIADISTESPEPSIDIVVASHRHQDHVSGFSTSKWKTVRVGEVWMPWTEDPEDDLATVIRNRQSRLALGLDLAFRSSTFNAHWADVAAADALRAIAANSLTNEAAMGTLHRGFRGNPLRRFLSAGNPLTITPEACPDLTVHVLAPSRDPDVIRDMDPPSGQSYLRYVGPGQSVLDDAPSSESSRQASQKPFTRSFTLSVSQYEADPLSPSLDLEVKEAAATMMRQDDQAVAVSLDKAVNGTSLMLMFEFREAFLFFPGDAQWGSWDSVLQNPAARELIGKTTFYKVGHHGSHNATPVEFVEKVLQEEIPLWGASASVRPISFWPEIPRAPLLEALATRAQRMVRSDQPGRSRKGVSVKSTRVDFQVPC